MTSPRPTGLIKCKAILFYHNTKHSMYNTYIFKCSYWNYHNKKN